MDKYLFDILVDPIDRTPLDVVGDVLQSTSGRTYPIIQGVPVMLVESAEQTIRVAERTLEIARQNRNSEDPWCLDSTVVDTREIPKLRHLLENSAHRPSVDPVISYLIGKTSGHLYKQLIGNLKSYPIPDIRVPFVKGTSDQLLLDVGCSWGRWSLSAANKGYNVVGLDPSLGAVLAGRRAAKQLGAIVHWVVGDARYLPFKDNTFDRAFSYSVIQHFRKVDADKALAEVRRVLSSQGTSLIQVANAYGVRSSYHLFRRGIREAQRFDVRYYTPWEILNMFQLAIGPSKISVDGFFGLGVQRSDMGLMPLKYKTVIYASEILRRLAQKIPILACVADSLYVESRKCVGQQA